MKERLTEGNVRSLDVENTQGHQKGHRKTSARGYFQHMPISGR